MERLLRSRLPEAAHGRHHRRARRTVCVQGTPGAQKEALHAGSPAAPGRGRTARRPPAHVGLRPAEEQALRAPHPLGRPHFQGIPMNPTNSDRRYVLLEQHAKLRMTIETARTSARKALAQRGSAGAMKAAVAALQRDLLAHLADEEK